MLSCFNPRAPRGARLRWVGLPPIRAVSIHAPREGRDLGIFFKVDVNWFQSTRPARGATSLTQGPQIFYLFQSTRPARGATRCTQVASGTQGFNPRAPRGARLLTYWLNAKCYVSIHAPREGRDLVVYRIFRDSGVSIHAPREGRDARLPIVHISACVSIHAPREGRDALPSQRQRREAFQSTRPARGATIFISVMFTPIEFQSTRPARGATRSPRYLSRPPDVSIHAPREGRDVRVSFAAPQHKCFNPRAPRGARLQTYSTDVQKSSFNPRAPRGARLCEPITGRANGVSIHAPREGRDPFNQAPFLCRRVSIHAPREGRDKGQSATAAPLEVFQSTRPARGAT